MTVKWSDPSAISNYFHRLTDGLGHRGSSFTDLDALTHDGSTRRFLIQEFKHEHEPMSPAQRSALEALAGLPRVTVWYVQQRSDGMLTFAFYQNSAWIVEPISAPEYQKRFSRWWTNEI